MSEYLLGEMSYDNMGCTDLFDDMPHTFNPKPLALLVISLPASPRPICKICFVLQRPHGVLNI